VASDGAPSDGESAGGESGGAASGEGAASGGAGGDGKRRQPAWLLKESRVRQRYEAKLLAAEKRLEGFKGSRTHDPVEGILPKLEALGDAVWFQGELYRSKMRTDQMRMQQELAQQARWQRELEAPDVEPFAPPDRPRALPTFEVDTAATMAAVEVPFRVASAMPSPRNKKSGSGSSGAGDAASRPATADGGSTTSARGPAPSWARQARGAPMRLQEPTALQQAYKAAGISPRKQFLQR
jgi:hypothetical protein